MDINKKIYLKSLTCNLQLLIKSNYKICQVSNLPLHQIPKDKFDVISLNADLQVQKYVNGNYFTYKVVNKKNTNIWLDKRHYPTNSEIIGILKIN
jgi:hypothetical protein